MNFPGRFLNCLRVLEDAILVLLLVTMILLAVYQIVLRNFYDSGLIWGESLLRVLVLWVGLLGAMVASRNGEHISIDLVARHVGPRVKAVIETITTLFCALICGLLAYHGARFVYLEYQDGLIAFAGVPTWVCELIIPIAFSLISLRYLLLTYHAVARIPIRNRQP